MATIKALTTEGNEIVTYNVQKGGDGSYYSSLRIRVRVMRVRDAAEWVGKYADRPADDTSKEYAKDRMAAVAEANGSSCFLEDQWGSADIDFQCQCDRGDDATNGASYKYLRVVDINPGNAESIKLLAKISKAGAFHTYDANHLDLIKALGSKAQHVKHIPAADGYSWTEPTSDDFPMAKADDQAEAA